VITAEITLIFVLIVIESVPLNHVLRNN